MHEKQLDGEAGPRERRAKWPGEVGPGDFSSFRMPRVRAVCSGFVFQGEKKSSKVKAKAPRGQAFVGVPRGKRKVKAKNRGSRILSVRLFYKVKKEGEG